MRYSVFLFFYLISNLCYSQFNKLDIGYGFGMSFQQNTTFEVANYPIEILLEGYVEQHGYARLSHTLKQFDILHTISISEFNLISYVYEDSTSLGYNNRTRYSNLSYDLTVVVFSRPNLQLVGGLKGNLYFINQSSQNDQNNFSYEIVNVSNALESVMTPTFGYILGIQTNPSKRLMLNFSFENTLTSYLGSINYNGVNYKPPKRRLPKFSLFVTYSIIKPKQ